MEAKLQRRIQRYGWDKAADAYEDGWRDSLSDAQAMVLHAARVRAGESVLDVACGTGLVTFPIAEIVGSTGQVLATDISDNMVAKLRRIARERRLDQVKAFRADAEDLHDVAVEWKTARQHAIQQHTDAVPIGRRGRVRFSSRLFGRHEGGRSHHLIRTRRSRVVVDVPYQTEV